MKIVRDESGSVSILVVLAFIILLGIVAIVTDIGMLFLERSRLSNAVDAAALAGVQELPFDTGKATRLAREYLESNVKGLQSTQISISNNNKEIRVVGRKTVRFALAPLLGVGSWELQASAGAKTDVVSAVTGVVPLAVIQQEFIFGEQYMLKYGPGHGQGSYYHGNFGALGLGGKGASVYLHNLAYGYDGVLRIGDWVSTEPGNMAGPTAQGVRARIDACNHPNVTYDNIPKGCERLIFVPVIESLEVNGRGEVKIVGFAAFFLESTSRRGNDSYIVGRFIRYAAQGEMGSGDDFGLKAAKLTE